MWKTLEDSAATTKQNLMLQINLSIKRTFPLRQQLRKLLTSELKMLSTEMLRQFKCESSYDFQRYQKKKRRESLYKTELVLRPFIKQELQIYETDAFSVSDSSQLAWLPFQSSLAFCWPLSFSGGEAIHLALLAEKLWWQQILSNEDMFRRKQYVKSEEEWS